MLTAKTIKIWYLVHKWTSLVCTAFLLVLCITGLPLIFRDEINHWLDDDPPFAALPPNTPMANLDRMVDVGRRMYPGQVVKFVYIDDDEPQVMVTLAPSQDAEPRLDHWLKFDARTAEVLKQSPPDKDRLTFMPFILHLHTDLFVDLPGELFLGLMGVLFVAALVSGVVLYGPFMHKLDFGTVRADRSPRLKWLDLHNLLGIVTLAWAFIIGVTGVINELSTPLFGLWRSTEVQAMLAPYQGKSLPVQLSPAQGAFDTVQNALPEATIFSIVYPGNKFGSPYHYLLWTKGNTPLTSRLFTPVLVDAQTGQLAVVATLPWYLKALEVSRPLHFGDYGGMPLKILWALLDLVTIVVLGSGLYLWLARRKMTEAHIIRASQESWR